MTYQIKIPESVQLIPGKTQSQIKGQVLYSKTKIRNNIFLLLRLYSEVIFIVLSVQITFVWNNSSTSVCRRDKKIMFWKEINPPR